MNSTNDLTGEKLFLRYAFPCAECMATRQMIRDHHMAELQALANDSVQPRRDLLKFCFHKAFRGLRKSALLKNIHGGEIWNIDIVRWHWRTRHNSDHFGDCAVAQEKVKRIAGSNIVLVGPLASGSSTRPVINLYSLPISPEDTVWIHRGVIAEVDKNTADATVMI